MKKLVVLFYEGQTDEEFYKELLKEIKKHMPNSKFCVDKIKNRCIKSVYKFENKLIKIFQNEIVNVYKDYEISVVLCYDHDIFELEYQNTIDREKIHNDLLKNGAKEVIHLEAKASVEDLIMKDIKGVISYLKIKTPRNVKGKNGYEKLKNLFSLGNKMYHKGFPSGGFISSLNMKLILEKDKDFFQPLIDVLKNKQK